MGRDFRMSEKWYGEAVTRDEAWYKAAKAAAIRNNAYNVSQVVNFMASDKFRIPIEDMDEWCEEGREAFPNLSVCRPLTNWDKVSAVARRVLHDISFIQASIRELEEAAKNE